MADEDVFGAPQTISDFCGKDTTSPYLPYGKQFVFPLCKEGFYGRSSWSQMLSVSNMSLCQLPPHDLQKLMDKI